MSDEGDRWEPMNFYSLAEDYYQSAIRIRHAQESGIVKLHSKVFISNFLFSHAVELALKGFLRAKGLSKKVLKDKYNHKFHKLINDSISHGLPLEEAERETAIKWVEEYDKEAINFRYGKSGVISLTDNSATESNVKRILRPACEDARDRVK
jgi:hypothetical protein